MKRIVVSEVCVACGACTLESPFLAEQPNGKAAPAGTGLITDEQAESLKSVIAACPVGAISIVEDEVTEAEGIDALLKLKELIEQRLRDYEPPIPQLADYDFDDREFKVPPLDLRFGELVSDFVYASWERAQSEGSRQFSRRIYPSYKTCLQALLVSYRTKRLSRYAYYMEEPGNYYYDACRSLSSLLAEISVMAKAVTDGRIRLPEDFADFAIGPDRGYDGELYCHPLRAIETYDWSSGAKPDSYFETYVNCDSSGEKYRYNLLEAEVVFREHIASDLSQTVWKRMEEWMDTAVKPFRQAVRKTINEKISIVNAALKACNIGVAEDVTAADLKRDLEKLMDAFRAVGLKPERVHKVIDTDYDSSYRFKSEGECRGAANNRLHRFLDSCQGYFSPRKSPRISDDLGSIYQEQMEAAFNAFKRDCQAIYDKYQQPYPKVTLRPAAMKQAMTMDLTTFDGCQSSIRWEIRDWLDQRMIGVGGKLRHWDYFEYDSDDISVNESWHPDRSKYGYTLNFSALSGFRKACEACCDYAYDDGFLQDYFKKLVESLLRGFEQEVLKPMDSL